MNALNQARPAAVTPAAGAGPAIKKPAIARKYRCLAANWPRPFVEAYARFRPEVKAALNQQKLKEQATRNALKNAIKKVG